MGIFEKTKLTPSPTANRQQIIVVKVDPFYGDNPVFLQDKSDTTSFLVAGSKSSEVNSGLWQPVNVPDFVSTNQEFLAAYQDAAKPRPANTAYAIHRIRIPVPSSGANVVPEASYSSQNVSAQQSQSPSTQQQYDGSYSPPQTAGFGGDQIILGLAALAGVAILTLSMRSRASSESLGSIPIVN